MTKKKKLRSGREREARRLPSTSLPARKLINWIREICEDITEHVGPFALLKLFQSTAVEANHILTIEMGAELRSNPDILAQRIWDTAEHEISTAYGVEQRFMVCAFRQDQEAYERRYPFKLTKHRTLEQLDGESVETDLTQQMLRQNSESHRQLMLMAGAHAERAEATIDRLTKQLSGLEDRHIKAVMLQEELLDRRRAERAVAEERAPVPRPDTQLVDWLKRVCQDRDGTGRPFTLIRMCQLIREGRPAPPIIIQDFELTYEYGLNPEILAGFIVDTADMEMENNLGVYEKLFVIFAWRADADEYESRFLYQHEPLPELHRADRKIRMLEEELYTAKLTPREQKAGLRALQGKCKEAFMGVLGSRSR
jgi:hypothetical protein